MDPTWKEQPLWMQLPAELSGVSPCRRAPAHKRLMRDHWEHFEHSAYIGVRGLGSTKAAAFEQAAVALTAIVTPPEAVAAHESVAIACTVAFNSS